MAEDASFRVKNTLVVNGAFIANATTVVAAAINATSVNTATANATTSIVVGANVTINTTGTLVGNTTANATISSTAIRISNSTTNTAIDPVSIVTGNSTVNATVNSTAFRLGNSTVNTVATAGQISISGATINSTIYTGTANNANNLGGVAASDYARLSGSSFTGAVAVTNNVTITGNLIVTGTTMYANVTNLDVKDLNITIAKGVASAAAADGAGLTVDTANVTWNYNHSTVSWQSNVGITPASNNNLSLGNASLVWANVHANNIQSTNLFGTLQTASQPNITANNSTNFGGLSLATVQSQITGNASTAYTNAITIAANATNLTSGTVATARLGSGTANSTTFLGGDQTYKTAVTSVASGSGLTGGPVTTTGTISVLANSGLSANATGVHVIANSGIIANATGVYVNANSGIVANSTGVFVNPNSGIVANSTGVYVLANSGIVANSTGVFVNANSGIIANATGVYVNANSGIVANSTGVFVNTAFIGTLTANNANNLNNQPASFYTNATNISTGTLDTARLPATANLTTAVNVGANVNLTTSSINVGNSTVNVFINSTAISVTSDPLVQQSDIGTAPDQIPLNQYLGTLAYQSDSIAVANVFAIGSIATFASNGNVGVGNSAPVHRLRVQGDVSLSGGIHANGSLGSAGQVLHSNGTVAYWDTDDPGVTSVATGSGLTGGPITTTGTVSVLANSGIVANSTGVFVLANSGIVANSTGVFVNANSGIIANSTGVFVNANSGIVANSTGTFVNTAFIGTLTANNSTNFNSQPASFYTNATNLATGTVPTARLGSGTANSTTFLGGDQTYKTAVTSVATGSGLTGGTVTTTGTVSVLANSGIVANATGVFVLANSGIVANSTGVFVNANSGIIANSTGVFVNANTGVVVNATGVFVNAAYINTIASNSATGSLTNTFTVGTASYFVSNGNLGIGNSAPAHRLRVEGVVSITSGIHANGSLGSSGQVLTSNGAGIYWSTGGVTADSTTTFTNKRIDPRVSSTASASSVTPDISSFDMYVYTALAAGLTINATTGGTPVNGNKLMFRFKDNGTARALTWTTVGTNSFRAVGVTLPTTTVINKVTYVGCVYNADESFWDVLAVVTQA